MGKILGFELQDVFYATMSILAGMKVLELRTSQNKEKEDAAKQRAAESIKTEGSPTAEMPQYIPRDVPIGGGLEDVSEGTAQQPPQPDESPGCDMPSIFRISREDGVAEGVGHNPDSEELGIGG